MRLKRHATEDAIKPDRTLCGETILERPCLKIDNADPDCGRCLRVIRSRCDTHNVRRCRMCK